MNSLNKIILIFLLIISLSSADNFSEEIYTNKVVKIECKELYKDYRFFREKALQSKDGTTERWFKISEEYKVRFLRCNNGEVKEKEYYTPNPYNSIKKQSPEL